MSNTARNTPEGEEKIERLAWGDIVQPPRTTGRYRCSGCGNMEYFNARKLKRLNKKTGIRDALFGEWQPKCGRCGHMLLKEESK